MLNREDDFKLALNVRRSFFFSAQLFAQRRVHFQVTNSCSWLYETFKTGLGPESVRLYSSNDPNAYEVVSVYTSPLFWLVFPFAQTCFP